MPPITNLITKYDEGIRFGSEIFDNCKTFNELQQKLTDYLTSSETDIDREILGLIGQHGTETVVGTRTVAEYLLSPVRKAWHEAGRER